MSLIMISFNCFWCMPANIEAWLKLLQCNSWLSLLSYCCLSYRLHYFSSSFSLFLVLAIPFSGLSQWFEFFPFIYVWDEKLSKTEKAVYKSCYVLKEALKYKEIKAGIKKSTYALTCIYGNCRGRAYKEEYSLN